MMLVTGSGVPDWPLLFAEYFEPIFKTVHPLPLVAIATPNDRHITALPPAKNEQ